MICDQPAPVGIVCPACNSVHPNERKRKLIIIAVCVVGAIVIITVAVIYANRRTLLYTDNHQPVFGWLPDLPVSELARSPGDGERPPRNPNSWWISELAKNDGYE